MLKEKRGTNKTRQLILIFKSQKNIFFHKTKQSTLQRGTIDESDYSKIQNSTHSKTMQVEKISHKWEKTFLIHITTKEKHINIRKLSDKK